MGLSIFDEVAPYLWSVAFDDMSGAGTYMPVGSQPTAIRIDQVLISTTDVAGVECYLALQSFVGDAARFTTVNVPAGAGFTAGTPAVNLLDPLTGILSNCIVPALGTLYLIFPGVLTAGALVQVVAVGGYV